MKGFLCVADNFKTFETLQYSVKNMDNGAAETLCQLDTEVSTLILYLLLFLLPWWYQSILRSQAVLLTPLSPASSRVCPTSQALLPEVHDCGQTPIWRRPVRVLPS